MLLYTSPLLPLIFLLAQQTGSHSGRGIQKHLSIPFDAQWLQMTGSFVFCSRFRAPNPPTHVYLFFSCFSCECRIPNRNTDPDLVGVLVTLDLLGVQRFVSLGFWVFRELGVFDARKSRDRRAIQVRGLVRHQCHLLLIPLLICQQLRELVIASRIQLQLPSFLGSLFFCSAILVAPPVVHKYRSICSPQRVQTWFQEFWA